MESQEQLIWLADKHGGILSAAEAVAAGVSRPALSAFVRNHDMRCVSRGIYCVPDAWQDDLFILQQRCPKTIFSHETALFFHDLTDREPEKVTVTAKTGYNPTHLSKNGIKVFTIKNDLFELGKVEVKTPFNNSVNSYDIDRTICDIIRSRNQIDCQVYQDALKQYARRADKNLHHLSRYARALHVERKVMTYLEVLL